MVHSGKEVRVLFDSGSQCSYIIKRFQSQLQLKTIQGEKLYLNTFGNKQFTPRNRDGLSSLFADLESRIQLKLPKLEESSVKLHTYTKEAIKVIGSIMVEVTYKTQVKTLSMLVVAGKGPSLIGRNWLNQLKVD